MSIKSILNFRLISFPPIRLCQISNVSATRMLSSHDRFFEEESHAKNYALFRPVPPKSLVVTLTNHLDQRRQLALDVGCGSGQSTLILEPYFDKVIGIDISKRQIEEALKLSKASKKVHFHTGCETDLNVEDNSVDLLTACQSIHWFDIPKFYSEAERVVRKGGVIGIYGYSFTESSPSCIHCNEITNLRLEVYEATKPHWSPKRNLVDECYVAVPDPPFAKFTRCYDHFTEVRGTLSDYIGYIETWSGFQQMKKVYPKQAELLVANFSKRVKEVLGRHSSVPSSEIFLMLRTKYFLLMCQKQ